MPIFITPIHPAMYLRMRIFLPHILYTVGLATGVFNLCTLLKGGPQMAWYPRLVTITNPNYIGIAVLFKPMYTTIYNIILCLELLLYVGII